MKYALFVGCTTLSRLPGYEKSARRLFEKLGVELVDMPGSGCCGTTYMESLSEDASLALAARNICIAEEMGLNIVTVCNGCAETLTKANRKLKEDSEARGRVNEILSAAGRSFKGTVEVKHLVRALSEDIGASRVKVAATKPYRGLRVAAHYGCHLLRPSDVMQFQDPNAPRAMDDLIEATGASSVQYPDKLECCGGPVMGIREQVTWSTGIGKVENARRYADILVTSCPFCYITYEKSQLMAESNPNLPVVHLPQLLGLAMGITEDDLGLSANKIDAGVLPARQEA